MVEVNIQLEQLRCIHQYDGGGASEPYLWVNFFFVDTKTITDENTSDFVATVNMLDGSSCRQIFSSRVRPGTVVDIPEPVGRFRVILDDSIHKTPGVGVVFAVLEENDTTDNLMRIGHQVFGQAFHEEINTHVRTHLPDVPPLTPQEEQAMAQRIKDRVFDAVADNASWKECFNTKDRAVGFAAQFFPWNVLTLLRDLAPGLPYPLSYNVRSERVIDLGQYFPPLTVVDEYVIEGSIRVSAFQPPTPSACERQHVAYTQAAQALREIDAAIHDLQTKLARTPAPQKPGIQKEIQELQQQRRAALARLETTHRAYEACLAQHSNAPA